MSATKSGRRIPPEVMDAIIDLLHDDFPALRECALVERALIPRARFHLFKRVRATLERDSEPHWKELRSLLDGTLYVKELEIVGEAVCCFTMPVLRLDTLGITPSAFPALVELKLYDVVIPSAKDLVELVLSLPSLEKLLGDHTTYADIVPRDESRWYSTPPSDPRPVPSSRSRRPSLKTLHLVNSTPFINGRLDAPAADILACLMDASLHVALEVLYLVEDTHIEPIAPAWVPLVRACARNLHTIMLPVGLDYNTARGPDALDALRALPRLRVLEFHYEASPTEELVAVPLRCEFLEGMPALVRGAPVPFPALESFTLVYHYGNPYAMVPRRCCSPNIERVLHEILLGLLVTRPATERKGEERCYPRLRHFGFRRLLSKWRKEYTAQLAVLREDLARIARGTDVEVEVSVSPPHEPRWVMGLLPGLYDYDPEA